MTIVSTAASSRVGCNGISSSSSFLPLISSSKKRRKGKRKYSLHNIILAFTIALLVLWLGLLLGILQHIKFNISSSLGRQIPCKAVYFWGGGKAGSTTLAALLKHDYDNTGFDPHGQFINSPKEICWAERMQLREYGDVEELDEDSRLGKWRKLTTDKCQEGTHGKQFVLDACPRYTTSQQAQLLLGDDPNAKFIMLVRDPIDRLVSHINDKRGSRGPSVDIEGVIRQLLIRHAGSQDGGRGRRRRWVGTNNITSPDAVVYRDNTRVETAAADRRRLNEEESDVGHVRIGRLERKDRKQELLRERLGKRKTHSDRRAERAALIRERGGGTTMRRAILGQRNEGIIPSKFDQLRRLSKNHWELSLYGKNLQSLLSVAPSSHVLVVQTDALSRDPQEVVNDIISFINGRAKKVKSLHENQLQGRDSYRTLSLELRSELETAFQSDVELLERLVGKTFPWSWVHSDGGNAAVDDWLTTVPSPDRIK